MPSTDEDFSSMVDIIVTREWLLQQLRTNASHMIILDCRGSYEFSESHIRQAVNLSIPSIMLRRLSAGKIDLISTIKCVQLKDKIIDGYSRDLFVVYGDGESQDSHNEIIQVLIKRLTQDGCHVVFLQEGFSTFHDSYPEWCEGCTELTVPGADLMTAPLMGLRSLRITSNSPTSHRDRYHLGSSCGSSGATSSTESSDCDDRCDSSLGLEDDKDFPVEILPYLFLGNAANSEDSESLSRHGIQYILNVTADLPNVFEDCGSMKYMQIPIADHWSQNLAKFFPKAIRFIDEGRDRGKGVLVHCLAGVSRSVTVTMAYLMYKLSLSLNEAFNIVRNRKANIAPNFHFMEQLHNFEQELKNHGSVLELKEEDEEENTAMKEQSKSKTEGESARHKCSKCNPATDCRCTHVTHSQFLSPLAIGTSPDSGIEFDRWTPAPGRGE